MLVLVRALVYATLFVACVLVFLPAQVLSWAGVTRPPGVGAAQIVGALAVVGGGALALWCVLAFALVGRGTPAPFDPPRRLVVTGPYRLVRNPMYVGAGIGLVGAALFLQSGVMAWLTGLFFLITHLFVLLYEEPVLRRTFGEDYQAYCRRVRRWWPRLSPYREERA
jgi:protein-S-isoprenylcysteine O-methyltransferase Ste14